MRAMDHRSGRNTACSMNHAHPTSAGLTKRAAWILPIAGFVSLLWFLVRVIPKPSRASYPCQRMAAPLASTFVIWLGATIGPAAGFGWARARLSRPRVKLVLLCVVLAAAVCAGIFMILPGGAVLADDPVPNAPIGIARGVNPGRVAWSYDPDATSWNGPGDGHWWESTHTSQAEVDRMMSAAVRALSGKSGDSESWAAFFRYFNRTHGSGEAGYRAGERIAIKVNLVGCIISGGGAVDPASYDMVRARDYMNTSPQMMVALLHQLVNAAGVPQRDISIGDPLSRFPNEYYDICRREFPDVHYLDHDGGNESHPRARVQPSAVPFYWSSRPEGKTQDYVPDAYAEAKYFINMANLKSHTLAGVTLCAKNHFGSLMRTPPQSGYYDMHRTLTRNAPGYGRYRALVDLMGHAHTGGKSLIYFIDGLYAGIHPIEQSPRKWNSAPFNGDWSSSLLASQDPVAIDSVAFDFLRSEWSDHPRMSGTDDYLHEAALAHNPPSGTFYDPDHATGVTRLSSLGVHEHWNNAQSRQYSRNLGTGSGIELVRAGLVAP